MDKIKVWDECGGCEHFDGTYYCENYDDFEKYPKSKITSIAFCTFHIYPIKLVESGEEEIPKYEIPEWCPVQDLDDFMDGSQCMNCGRKTKKLTELFSGVWICGCCNGDIAMTVAELEEKGIIK